MSELDTSPLESGPRCGSTRVGLRTCLGVKVGAWEWMIFISGHDLRLNFILLQDYIDLDLTH